MVSRYSLLAGLGLLYLLPLEIRIRIHRAYFSDRIVVQDVSGCRPLYDRNLLSLSKAIREEAAPYETEPGIVLQPRVSNIDPHTARIRASISVVDLSKVR